MSWTKLARTGEQIEVEDSTAIDADGIGGTPQRINPLGRA